MNWTFDGGAITDRVPIDKCRSCEAGTWRGVCALWLIVSTHHDELPLVNTRVMDQNPIQQLRNILKAQEREHEPWTSGWVGLSEVESTFFVKCKDGSAQ